MNLDPEYLSAVEDRIERIRDYVPAEEFDISAALGIAQRELSPYFDSSETFPRTISPKED